MVESTGLKDFLQLFETKTPLAVLAVKAPAGFVTGALADTFEVRHLVEGCAIRQASRRPATELWSSVVQLRDDPWTFVLWAAGAVPLEAQAGIGPFALDLSGTLGTEAISMLISVRGMAGADDEIQDSASGFCVYRDGEVVEHGVLSPDGKVLSFDSTERQILETQATDLDTLDHLVSKLGLYWPPCAPDSEGDRGWLVIGELDPGQIARADLVAGNLRIPSEEETLDMLLEESGGVRTAVRSTAPPPAESSPDPATRDQTPSPESMAAADADDDTRVVIPRPESSDIRSPGLIGRFNRWVGRLFYPS